VLRGEFEILGDGDDEKFQYVAGLL